MSSSFKLPKGIQGTIHLALLLVVLYNTLFMLPWWQTPRVVEPTYASIRMATYNLRYDSQPDNITVQESLEMLDDPLETPDYLGRLGEQPWSIRRIKVAQNLLQEGVVLVCACRFTELSASEMR